MANDTARIGVRADMKSSGWTRLKATNVWQAAFVRPFEDKANWKKHMAVLLSYGFGLLFVVSPIEMLIDDALSWPVPLEQMRQTSGVLTDIVISRRGPSYLVVTEPDGNEQRFFARWLLGTDLRTKVGRRVASLRAHEGHRVTVWSQDGFELFYGRIHEAIEVKLDSDGGYVMEYIDRVPDAIAFDEKDHYWLQAMLAFGLFLVARPVWKHRSSIVETQQSTERGE